VAERLAGRTIVVTGGASGLGRAMALAFAREGAHVVVGDVKREPTEGGEPTDALIGARGGSARFQRCDVSEWDDICALVDAALEHSGRLDVMVNNAVLHGALSKGLLETTTDDWDRMMAVGLRGVFLCCKRAIGRMLEQEPVGEVRGRVINMSSQMAFIGSPGHVTYCTMKGGVANLTRQLAVDFGPRGVLVNAIAPGRIPTDERTPDPPDRDAYYRSRTPFGRLGRPEDVAGTAVFLASDDCSYVSGAHLFVDGGWMAY
jgi:NAD(P)-dependent dehydrogenase (short-subunit alcohol dehydrogenase family)